MPATQVAEPAKTTLRTIIQTVLGIVLAAGIVIPAAVLILQEEMAQWLPAELTAVLVTVGAVAAALSAALTRIMAIPAVNHWLRKLGMEAGSGHGPDTQA